VTNLLIAFTEALHIPQGRQLKPVKLYPYQAEILEAAYNNRFTVACLPKRCGKSFLSAAFALFYAIHYRDSRVVILSTSREQAQTVVFDYIRRLLRWNKEMLGDFVRGESQVRLEMRNGSVIETVPCVVTAVAGKAIDLLLIDELALIDDEEVVQVALSQTEREDCKIFVTSTASDEDNLLYRLYRDADELGVKFIYYGAEAYQQAAHISPKFLEERRKMMPDYLFRRYHMNEFGNIHETVFNPELVELASRDYSFKDRDDAVRWLEKTFGKKVSGRGVVVGLDRAMPYANRDKTVTITTMVARFEDGEEVYIVLDETVFETGGFTEVTNAFRFLMERFQPDLFVLEAYQAADIAEWLEKTMRKEVEVVSPTPKSIQAAFGFAIRLFESRRILIPRYSELSRQLPKIRRRGNTYEGKPYDDAVFAFVWSLHGTTKVRRKSKPFIYILGYDDEERVL